MTGSFGGSRSGCGRGDGDECRQQADSSARFCRRCGTDLESSEACQLLGVAVVEQGPQALDDAASPRALWVLSGLPVAISVVYSLVTRFVEASAVAELVGLGAIALVALGGAVTSLRPTEALIVQAVLFSAAHLSPVILATHFAMGLAFGWLRRRTGSLLPSILLHGAWNAWVIWTASV